MKKQGNPVRREQGSVIIWVLIAVVLFAMLSAVISRGGRSGQTAASAEQVRLAATEIMAYASSIRNAVKQLQVNGCSETQISFENPATGVLYDNPNAPADHSCDVFHPDGAALSWTKPPDTIMPIIDYYRDYFFVGRSAVQDVGTSAGELYIWLRTRSKETCMKLNELAGVANAASDAPSDGGMNGSPFFIGAYSNGTTISGGGALNGKMIGCYKDTNEADSDGTSYYDFYQVLIAR